MKLMMFILIFHLYIRKNYNLTPSCYRFHPVTSLYLDEPIGSVSITKGYTHILVGLVGTPSKMIVVVRDSDAQLRPNIVQNVSAKLLSGSS